MKLQNTTTGWGRWAERLGAAGVTHMRRVPTRSPKRLRPKVLAGSRMLLYLYIALPLDLAAQDIAAKVFTHADTLRGSNTPQRSWWDATFYDLHVKVNPADSSISGYNSITYRVIKPAREMQIDLQLPLVVDSIVTYEWFVSNPINNYDVAVNAGHYEHFNDVYEGEKGKLTLDFFPLDYHVDTARKQFQQVKPMLQCFESWFGPYPWYEDGYKLVETPHLGMEHQSAVAYGNHYKNGYLGRDRSQSGRGLLWDFIIIHESAHEWFGNNITMKDQADMWIHESFATYAEGLYTECQQGKKAGAEYTLGQRKLVRNDRPIVGSYGVNDEGSGDMYDKGGNMLHTIRQLVDDDARWRGILRGLNKTFWHQTVTGKQVEDYISRQSGINLGKVFDEY